MDCPNWEKFSAFSFPLVLPLMLELGSKVISGHHSFLGIEELVKVTLTSGLRCLERLRDCSTRGCMCA